MPSHDLLVRPRFVCSGLLLILTSMSQLYFQDDLSLVKSWYVSGQHFQQTSEHWLQRQDANAKAGLAELEKDAVAKGLSKEEGRKAFFRYASYRIVHVPCSRDWAASVCST